VDITLIAVIIAVMVLSASCGICILIEHYSTKSVENEVSLSSEGDTKLMVDEDVLDHTIVIAMNRYTDLDREAASDNLAEADIETIMKLANLGYVVVNSVITEAISEIVIEDEERLR